MYQFLLADLPGRFVKPRNLLPTGVKIASNKHHRRLLLPSQASWSSNYRVPGIETEPSLLSNQHVGFTCGYSVPSRDEGQAHSLSRRHSSSVRHPAANKRLRIPLTILNHMV